MWWAGREVHETRKVKEIAKRDNVHTMRKKDKGKRETNNKWKQEKDYNNVTLYSAKLRNPTQVATIDVV